MRFLILAILLIVVSLTSQSQDDIPDTKPGKVRGKVVDSLSAQAIEYATVTLFPDSSPKPIAGASTDNKGLFTIGNLPTGAYRLVIDFIGYKTNTRSIKITSRQPDVALGSIPLANNTQTLADVTVTGQKKLIENKIDKLVYNVEKDITSQGGLATDVLKKIPMISVDVDGNVELQGSSSIQFLINGKPSTLFGNSIADALQSIPASQIKSIEVITSPGARYDAEGTGGIINIILKDNKTRGVNGTVNLSAGTRLNNGSLNLNARNGNFGLNASASASTVLKGTTLNSLYRNSVDSNGGHALLSQDGQGTVTRNSYKGLLGFDWSITQHDNLTGSISYNRFERNSTRSTHQQQTFYSTPNASTPDSVVDIRRDASTRFDFHTIDGFLDYKKTFRQDGQELDLSFQSSNGTDISSYFQTQLHPVNNHLFSGAQGHNTVVDHETILQLDYIQPLQKDAKLELGAKTTISHITGTSDYFGLNPSSGKYDPDSFMINDFTYHRVIYAGYATLTVKLSEQYSLKVGGRFERTNINADFPSATGTHIPSYNFFMPAVALSRSLKNSQTLKLSYTRRIQRAGYEELNPFLDVSDPTNISTGNPALKPELVHYIELSYAKNFDNGGSFGSSLYSRYSTQDLQSYIYYYPSLKIGDSIYTNVAVNTTENVGIQNVAGINFFGNAPITSKLTVRGSIVFYDLYIKNKLIPDNTANYVNYRTNINATYQVSSGLVCEFSGNFRSPSREIQGSSTTFITYSFAFKKIILHKNGSIGFTTTNPFNKYVDLRSTLTGQNFSLVNDRKVPYRSFGISFYYKFGKLEFKKKDDNGDQSENP